jgi:hypothetical protein
MKVYLIYPGHDFATVDVARGFHHGFEALGCEVKPYQLSHRAQWFARLLRTEHRLTTEELSEAAFAMAGEEIFGKLLRFNPDLIVVINGEQLHGLAWQALDRLRERADYPVHLVLTECPYEDKLTQHLLERVTVAWANDKTSAERHGCEYLPAAYCPVQHRPPEDAIGSAPDVLFVGTGWPERVEFFGRIDWSDVHFRIVGPQETWKAAEGTPLASCVEYATLPGQVLWAYYAGSGAVVNLHRRSVGIETSSEKVLGGYSLNPRCYQVPACGGLLLSDSRPEFREVFGDALPVFHSAAELHELVRHFLANPRAREDAIYASMAAVAPHTYTARAGRILEAA